MGRKGSFTRPGATIRISPQAEGKQGAVGNWAAANLRLVTATAIASDCSHRCHEGFPFCVVLTRRSAAVPGSAPRCRVRRSDRREIRRQGWLRARASAEPLGCTSITLLPAAAFLFSVKWDDVILLSSSSSSRLRRRASGTASEKTVQVFTADPPARALVAMRRAVGCP
jgi:hypothetical protein